MNNLRGSSDELPCYQEGQIARLYVNVAVILREVTKRGWNE
jgi:hypothetical protein